MASFKLLLLFIVVSFLSLSTTEAQDSDSRSPNYLRQNCSINRTTAGSAFQLNIGTLFSSLISNAAANSGFYNATVSGTNPSDTVYGLFMCRGDVPSQLCRQCVLNATQRLSSQCSLSKEAVTWYDECMIRYSSRCFFSTLETSPMFVELNTTTSTLNPNFFTLSNTLDQLIVDTRDTNERYKAESLKLNALQTLYSLAQCTLDLSSTDCNSCLTNVIGSAIPWARLESASGGRVLYPSCNMRFELFQFYRGDGGEAQPPKPVSPSPSGKRKRWSRTIILIVVPTCALGMLFYFGYYLWRKKRESYKTILVENFGHESATLERLQFELAMIEEATNNFSRENLLGKGGFGEVYKGILPDGKQVAAKRLSIRSKQGAIEFKNEVLLIAKLQHKNLVAFIGFCLEKQEKILVYEYVPNKSLDYLLFDTTRQKLLSWFHRYNIIKEIARGILYLHEYSRLKIIHRDLKPSNILLDENMIPKISDFGLARIVENQDQGSTKRIAGTYGYMSPEYAMLGQFSEKSDVFSFGVMVLEIISGKKNTSSYESHHANNLLCYVWRLWMGQTPLSILDPSIEENYSKIEVIKCIQIGLLCVQQNPDARPTMATVVSSLSNHSIELPTPQKPAFVLHTSTRMDLKATAQESSSDQPISSCPPFSINEMATTDFLPR